MSRIINQLTYSSLSTYF